MGAARQASTSATVVPIENCPSLELSSSVCPAVSAQVSLHGRVVRALIDTGASVSLVSSRLVRSFPFTLSYSARQCPTVVGVSGQALSCFGITSIPVVAANVPFLHDFVVAELFHHDVILGSDFFVTSGCIIDLSSSLLRIGSECVPLDVVKSGVSQTAPAPSPGSPLSSPPLAESVRACVSSTTVLQPQHAVLLPCTFSAPGFGDGVPLVTPLASFTAQYPTLSVSSPIVSTENVVVEITNWGDDSVTLYSGKNVGTVEFVAVVDSSAESCASISACSASSSSAVPVVDLPARLAVIDQFLSGACCHLSSCDLAALRSLLVQYHDVFVLLPDDAGYCDIAPHRINTGAAVPIKQQARRLPFHQRQSLQGLLDDLLQNGVIRPSHSPWAAPIVLVKKPDGSNRLCVDYRKMNAVTVPDAYPLPRISDTLDSFSGCSVFSTLDLATGYWQLAMAEGDQCKTAFTTPLGLYEFTVMPMGCCNGPATFQRVMERVLSGLLQGTCSPITRVFFDDIGVATDAVSTSLSQLAVVFDRLRSANLKLKLRKCVFLQSQAKFLGVDVSAQGIHTSESKIQAIRDWPQPKDVSAVRSFLGLATYYRRFISGFAQVVSPLTALTAKGATFRWSPACATAFRILKDRLSSAPILAYPDFSSSAAPFILDTDASACGMGAVLSQQQDGIVRPIAYGSKLFNKAQCHYSVTERELLAVVYFVTHFRHYLMGKKFTVRTDHMALKWLRSLAEPTGRKARWLETLAEFDFHVDHRPGRQHANADALSRRAADLLTSRSTTPCAAEAADAAPVAAVRVSVVCTAAAAEAADSAAPSAALPSAACSSWLPCRSSDSLREAQLSDPDLAIVLSWYDDATSTITAPTADAISGCSRTVHRYASDAAQLTVRNGVLHRQETAQSPLQLAVPPSLQEECLLSVHSAPAGGHFGFEKTLLKCRERFFWPGQSSSIRQFLRECDVCATCKKSSSGAAPLQSVTAGYPGQLVAMDLVGPLPVSDRRNRYILVCVDYFTRWPEAYALPDMTASTVAKTFVDGWISRFGVPDRIHSDQGPQFESTLFAELCTLLDARKSRTTPYHPAGDGLVERMNRTLITTLRSYANDHPTSWDEYLQPALLSYRTAVQKSTDFTPARLMFGRELRLPPDIVYGLPPACQSTSTHSYVRSLDATLRDVYNRSRRNDTRSHRYQKDYYDRRTSNRKFKIGDRVWLLNTVIKPGESSKLHRPWTGPFTITAITGTSHDIVLSSLPNSPPKRVHFNRLKLCQSAVPLTPPLNDTPDPALQPRPPEVAPLPFFHWTDDDHPLPFVLAPAAPPLHHRAHLRRHAGCPVRYRNN